MPSDSALRFMARDLRSALPNSVRTAASGSVTALELLATADGARYQDNGPVSNPALVLDFTAPDGAFATTVPFTQLTLPWSVQRLLFVHLQRRRAGRRMPIRWRTSSRRPAPRITISAGAAANQNLVTLEPRVSIRVRLPGKARVPGQRPGLLPLRYVGRHPDPLRRATPSRAPSPARAPRSSAAGAPRRSSRRTSPPAPSPIRRAARNATRLRP